MLRRFTLLFLLFTLTSGLYAQVGEHRSELAFGVSGGYMMSTVGFTPSIPQKQHTGIMGGVALRYTSEKYFSSICAIQIEANIARLGWQQKILGGDDVPVINAETGLPEAYSRNLTYLQVPFLTRLGWGRERRGVQFYFVAGPQVGFLLSESTTKNYATPNVAERNSPVIEQESMPVENKIDYGITAGLGLEISFPHLGRFLVEGRYYFGLGNIYGNSKRDYFAKSNLSAINVRLSYMIDLWRSDNKDIK